MNSGSSRLPLICRFEKTFAGKGLPQSLYTSLAIIVGSVNPGVVASADEVHLPTVNLGDTTFEDEITFPGWIAEEIVDYYYAGQVNDSKGQKVPGSNKFIMPKRHGCTSIVVLGGPKNRREYGGVMRKQYGNESMKGTI